MGVEIERKFLVRHDGWRRAALSRVEIVQGYLANTAKSSIRLRVAGNAATLSVKGMTPGMSRDEFEYAIPEPDAKALLNLAVGQPIEKTRRRISFGGSTWEVDIFGGANRGLVVAEIELQSESDTFEKPEWLGAEVTADPRYANCNLIRSPFQNWG